MIVDFRIRPPYKNFLNIHIYRQRNPKPDPVTIPGLQIGLDRYRSYEERSMTWFMKEMDEAKIDLAVIMGRQSTAAFGNVPNEEIAELVRDYPGRFVGVGGVDGADVPGSLREIDRIVDLGFKGVAMDNGWGEPPRFEDDEKLFPIYEKVQARGLFLSLTSSIFLGDDLSYSNPVHIQRVARAFPKLKIVVPHGCWPWATEACGVALQCTNVYLAPDFYMYLPVPGAEQYVKAANFYLSYRMLYSSSYPVRPLKQSVEQFSALPFSTEEIRQRGLGENALRLLGMKT